MNSQLLKYVELMAKATVVFLLFDLNIAFDMMEGGGERLSQGVDSAGGHEHKSSLTLRVKIADALLFVIIALQLFFIKNSTLTNSITKRSKILIALFGGYSLVLLASQSGLLSTSQLSVSVVYLIKFLTQFFYFLFFVYYFSQFDETKLMKIIAYTVVAAAVIGIFSSLTSTPLPLIMSNRIEYYGQIGFAALLILQVIVTKGRENNFFGISKGLLILIFTVSAISIALCGKRTPLTGFSIGVFYIIVQSFRHTASNKFAMLWATGIGLAGFFMSGIIEHTFMETEAIYSGIDERFAERIQSNMELMALSSVDFSSLSGIDGSTAERIVKLLLSIDLIIANPFGVGFWNSIFLYNFLPDSILQFPLENGMPVFILSLWGLYTLWRRCGLASNSINQRLSLLGHTLRAMILSFVIMSITVNMAYSFKLIATFFIFYALMSTRLTQSLTR